MKHSAEEKFLIDAHVLSKPVLSGRYDLNGLDWKKIFSVAEKHWLGFYLEKIIKSHKLKIDIKYWERLAYCREREKLRYAYFKKKLPVILRTLNKAKVKYAVLKGGYLAFSLYPAGARYLSDIDILVSREERGKAAWALIKAGFVEDNTKSDNDTLVLRDIKGMEVELSSELGQLKGILPAKELLQNISKVKILGVPASILNKEYNLLHLCLHISMTHSFYDIAKLVDINEFLKKYKVNMRKLEHLARSKGVFRSCFMPIEFTGIFWHNRIGLRYAIDRKLTGYFVKYNLSHALTESYNKRSAFYSFFLPVLLADSYALKFRLVRDYFVKKVKYV
ncbi:MAG: nucleotidyltransferase family protein [Candidatus Firestonebacteria bacterium]